MAILPHIIDRIERAHRGLSAPYIVPGLWLDGVTTGGIQIDPYEFYQARLSEIAAAEPRRLVRGSGGEWSRYAIIYNLFPRVTTAFDHDGDGHLRERDDGWRETGTLLKCIALLPYIRRMGFNTVHLLPITAIGQDGRKGTLGSPYAIRNPYELDNNLAEPALGLSADDLFAGFVEAAHLLGIRVVMEFVLRTASKDSDWICQHPDWFYWIRADIPDRVPAMGRTRMLNSFGQPIFSQDDVNLINWKVGQGDFDDLPPPMPQYRAMYTPPPRPDQIRFEHGRCIGTLNDGTEVRVPGAFTDWPLNDSQPPWSDVTYLRLYDHADFNYMAYNTVRMYDNRFATPGTRNNGLWDTIVGVIPHYQRNFGIDGVLIDMGHALPMPLKQRIIEVAREVDDDFAFWDENFAITSQSREEGYNAVVGYWTLSVHEGGSMRNMLNQMSRYPFPIAYFGAPENHNTPRAFSRPGGVAYAHYALALAITIPAIPFILSGFELGETQPINTGIGFSAQQVAQYPPEHLPLFSEWVFNWTRADNYVKSVRYAMSLRKKYEALFTDTAPETFLIGHCDNPAILVYTRRRDDQWVSVIANTDMTHEQRGRAVINGRVMRVAGLWGTADHGMDLSQEVNVMVNLSPGYTLIADSSAPNLTPIAPPIAQG